MKTNPYARVLTGEDPRLPAMPERATLMDFSSTARQITVHDIYSFDPNVHVEIEEFTDIIGRNFRQPEPWVRDAATGA